MVSNPSKSINDFANIVRFYKDDLPSINSFEAEVDLWYCKWRREQEMARKLDTLGKTLSHTDREYFPNIHTMLVIAVTLPITSCECERSISALRFLKTCLRSTMSQERLNGLAMLQYHKDIHFTRRSGRKIRNASALQTVAYYLESASALSDNMFL